MVSGFSHREAVPDPSGLSHREAVPDPSGLSHREAVPDPSRGSRSAPTVRVMPHSSTPKGCQKRAKFAANSGTLSGCKSGGLDSVGAPLRGDPRLGSGTTSRCEKLKHRLKKPSLVRLRAE